MRIGIQGSGQLPTELPDPARYRAVAELAEELGYDSIWAGEHLSFHNPILDLGVALATFAAVTRRIMLGAGVVLLPLRHPSLVAKQAGSLDYVSGGRLLLGLGAGGNRRTPYAAEQQAIGQSVERDEVRARRVVEAIELMRRLWSGHAGFLRPEPPPPIIVGGFGPRMAAIGGRHGDGFNTQAMHPRLADLAKVARDEHKAAGRDASPFLLTVFAGLDERWLAPDSRPRQSLERVGVERLILLTEPPFDPEEIRASGRLLAPRPT